jgi:hypothetical protein
MTVCNPTALWLHLDILRDFVAVRSNLDRRFTLRDGRRSAADVDRDHSRIRTRPTRYGPSRRRHALAEFNLVENDTVSPTRITLVDGSRCTEITGANAEC